jgi:hypothetical protein
MSSTNNHHSTNTGYDGHVEAARTTGTSPPVWRDRLGRWHHSPERLAIASPEADWKIAVAEMRERRRVPGSPRPLGDDGWYEAGRLVAEVELARAEGRTA